MWLSKDRRPSWLSWPAHWSLSLLSNHHDLTAIDLNEILGGVSGYVMRRRNEIWEERGFGARHRPCAISAGEVAGHQGSTIEKNTHAAHLLFACTASNHPSTSGWGPPAAATRRLEASAAQRAKRTYRGLANHGQRHRKSKAGLLRPLREQRPQAVSPVFCAGASNHIGMLGGNCTNSDAIGVA